jgi:hypothetical protein
MGRFQRIAAGAWLASMCWFNYDDTVASGLLFVAASCVFMLSMRVK